MKSRPTLVAVSLVALAGLSTLGIAVARATLDGPEDALVNRLPSLQSRHWAALTIAHQAVEPALERSTTVRYRDEFLADDQLTVCGTLETAGADGSPTPARRYLSDGRRFLIEGNSFRTWPTPEAGGDAVMSQAVELIEDGRRPDASVEEHATARALAGPTFEWYWKKRCARAIATDQPQATRQAATHGPGAKPGPKTAKGGGKHDPRALHGRPGSKRSLVAGAGKKRRPT